MGKITGNNLEIENALSLNGIPIEDLGSGGGEAGNYIDNASKNANGLTSNETWTVYNNTPGNAPVSGIGGSADILWNRFATPPVISGNAEFRLVKDGSNRRGQGVSIPFTIDQKDLAKKLQITFDLKKISGNYSIGDLRVYIIADPAGTPIVIEPVNVEIDTAVDGLVIKHIATFQTQIDQNNYRLCIHVASTSIEAYTVAFNNFRVWEQDKNYGAIITDPVKYTPIIDGSTGITNDEIYWWREGKHFSSNGRFQFGTTSAIQFRYYLPFTISSEVVNIRVFGRMYQNGNVSTSPQFILKGVGGQNYLTLGIADTTGNNAYTDINTSFAFSSNREVTFNIDNIPIQGWGSSMVLSSESGDGREVVFQAKKNTNQSSISDSIMTKVTWQTIGIDTIGQWDSSNNEFIIPYSGFYDIFAVIRYDAVVAGRYLEANIYINNTNVGEFHYEWADFTDGLVQINRKLKLKEGDRVSIFGRTVGGSFTIGTAGATFGISKISASSQIIARDEVVAFRIQKDGGSTSPNNFITSWANKLVDTHNSVDLTTGEWTCPVSGLYSIGFLLGSNNYLNTLTAINAHVRKDGVEMNGSTYGRFWNGSNSTYDPGFLGHNFISFLNKGEKLRLYYTGFNYTIGHKSGLQGTYFEVYRIG
jgi:hypothetical protein